MEVLLMEPAALDQAIASGDEYLDGKSISAWFSARQLLGL
jgi:ADP-ribose pyrophosphatase